MKRYQLKRWEDLQDSKHMGRWGYYCIDEEAYKKDIESVIVTDPDFNGGNGDIFECEVNEWFVPREAFTLLEGSEYDI